jgi:hypothetical protein
MNKTQLIQAIQALSYIDWIGTETVLETKADGTTWCSINIREVLGDVAIYRNLHYYVVPAGSKGSERAYYKDQLPTSTLQSKSNNEIETV